MKWFKVIVACDMSLSRLNVPILFAELRHPQVFL